MTTQDFFSLGILHRALGWHSVTCNPEHESSWLTPSPHFLQFSWNRKLLSPNAVKSCGLYPCWPRKQSLLWRQKEFIGLIFVDKRLICCVPPLSMGSVGPTITKYYFSIVLCRVHFEKRWAGRSTAGIKIAERNINNLRYADDTTLMAESEEELKSLLKRKVKKLA